MSGIELALTNWKGCPSQENKGSAVSPTGPSISLDHNQLFWFSPPSLNSSHVLVCFSTSLSMIAIVKLFLLFFLKLVSEGHRQIFLLWHMWTEQVACCTFYMRKLKLRKGSCGFHGATCRWSEAIWSSKNRKPNNSSSSSLYTKPPSKDRTLPYVCLEPGLSTQEMCQCFSNPSVHKDARGSH